MQRFHRRPAVEFYDIVNDPEETRNLADNPEYANELSRMASHLESWMIENGDTVKMQHQPYLLSKPYPGKL